ncbi:hypothetical protein JQW35_13060 [Sulfitobacter pseudonitzschiae]|nr:hypothetical protein [Pseudosulfitobacter pseudonitzschiae]
MKHTASDCGIQSPQTAAETARDKAQRWATEAQGVEVETGLYSAYHHALAAAASAGSASDDLGAIVLVKEAVETIFDNFDDRYLGSFSTANEPTLDNDGDAIQIGAIYLNTDEDELRFWNGALWKSPEATAEAAAAAALASAAAAGTSETNAATSETKAQQWAEQVEDVEVEAGQYSALHHAAKAEEHANAASLASNATKWVSEGAYDEGQLVWSPLNGLTYRSLVAHSDETTDPSLDEINFGPATGGSSVEWGDVENKPTAFPPSTHDHAVSDITGLQGALDAKAPLASPTLTGTPTVPTATPGTNTTQIANTAFVKAALDNLLAGAPGALDTLNELAAAIGDDADFAGTITAALALKANTADLTPVATAGTYASLTGKPTLGTAAALSVPVSGDAASGEVVKGNDSRLTDARAPTSHNHDDRYYTESEVTSALSGKANSYHTHTVSHLPIATQAQAEAGTLSTVLMTPQRTAQAIAELVETGGSEVYSGSSNTETNFPVGHTILVNSFSTDTARNASAAVYTRSDSNAEEYVLTDQGDLLAGTWRARGNAGNYTVFQRTA